MKSTTTSGNLSTTLPRTTWYIALHGVTGLCKGLWVGLHSAGQEDGQEGGGCHGGQIQGGLEEDLGDWYLVGNLGAI